MEKKAAAGRIGLTSEIRTFHTLLGGDVAFEVPYLQRQYEWGEAEVSAMVGDLQSASEGGYDCYFLGHIVGVKNDRGHIDLVDGQQRLVTTTMLFAMLRDHLTHYDPVLSAALQDCIEAAGRVRVKPRPSDAAFLHEWVQTPGRFAKFCALDGTAAGGVVQSDAQALMVQAGQTISAQLDMLALEAMRKLAVFVLENAVIDFIVADTRSMAAILYRGMNMRGKQLSPADLIKLDAIESAHLDDVAKESVARSWEVAEDKLRRDNFAFFLEIFPLIVSQNPTMRPGDLAEWRKYAFQGGDPREVLEKLLPVYADVFEEILDGEVQLEGRDNEEKAAIIEVNALLRGMLFLQEDREWIAPAISAVHAHRGRPVLLARFFRGLDRLAFACFLDGVQPKERNRRFAEIVAAGADDAWLDHAFRILPHEAEIVSKRLRQQFRRDTWRRRAVAARVSCAFSRAEAIRPSEDFTIEHVAPTSQSDRWRGAGWGPDQIASSANLLGNFVLVPKALNNELNRRLFDGKVKLIFDNPKYPVVLPITRDIRDVKEWTDKTVRARTDRLADMLMKDWGL